MRFCVCFFPLILLSNDLIWPLTTMKSKMFLVYTNYDVQASLNVELCLQGFQTKV